jgi:uncharacterized protein Smg (DUF494 family)
MIERIKEIIAFLMDPDRSEIQDQLDIHDTLSDMGYSSEEIYHALNMISFDTNVEDQIVIGDGGAGVRVLSEIEKSILSIDAQGHLLRLLRLGWLSEVQLSLIIETAAIENAHPVSLEEIKELSTRYVSDLPDDPSHDRYKRSDKSH